jgi:hypothetical protein
MANSRKRISELPPLNVASLDTTFVLGISGSTTYKISINNLTSSLDGAFATDLVTNALSSSLNSKLSTSSFNSYTASFTASVASGTISGSSQLTSSFDTRYTLSGSIPNIPTGSFATTGSNTFNGDMTLISSSNIILKGPALEYGGDGISGSGDIIWQDLYGNEMARLWKAADRDILTVSFTGSHNSYVYGTLIHSLNLKEFGDDHFITTSSFNSYTASQSTSSLVNRLNAIESVSGSWITESETGSFLTSLSGAISSSTQIADLGFVTGSYTTINSFNSLTQSFNSISQSFTTISSSVGGVDFNGVISSSAQITTLGFVSGSYLTSLSGAISSSSQLTSSYDTRYVISGSIGAVPVGTVSGSSQVLGGSGVWSGSAQLPTGIISGSSQLDGTTITNLTVTNLTTVNQTASILYTSGSTIHGDFGDDTHSFTGSLKVSGSVIITGSLSATSFNGTINSTNGVISGSSQLTSSFDTRYVASGSISAVPAGTISGSAQITTLGFISSSTTINTTSFATTGSNSFNGNQNITGSLVVSAVAVVAGALTIPSASVISLTSGSSISVDASGAITGSLTGSVFGIGDVVTFSASLNSRIISGSSVAGTISGSSQLTSSYDSRYSLSGSVLTSFSSSVDNRLDTLEASIITGSPNYVQVLGNRRTGINTVNTSIISGSITTTGNPVQIMVTGDANPITTAWARLQIYRDGSAIGAIVQVENSSNLNVPYCVNVIDTPSAGTYVYSMRLVDSMSGTFDFGEASGPILTAVELNSKTSFPSGTISGSSQLTSSYDTRYTLSGSISATPAGTISGSSQLTSSYDTRYTLSGSVVSGTTPAGTISGSSQLTSSFDGRYTQTGSFNTLTASFNSFTASAQSVTTGSNSFNGTQTITGSLIITTGSFVASQIVANTASLYLTSGSNLYVQNNGLVEITGSLNVSGTATLKGAVNIGTGSGAEGGEIQLAYAQTGNTTLTGSAIAFDVYGDKIRIFEGGGTNKGAYLNVASQSAGVGSSIVTSPNLLTMQTITSASYAALTPVSGTLYIIIG